MAVKTSSTSSSKTVRALAIAALLLAIANIWLGVRLPAVLPESQIDNALELERRVAAVEDKRAVKVLVFGNSHAVAGLRPPDLASAFGLRPEEVFSLAMPGGSPQEMRLLAERYLPLFPQVEAAFCGVEEYFLSGAMDTRVRYMTRFSIAERWRYARMQPKLDDRLGLMATQFLPAADFGVALRAAIVHHPALTARRLFRDEPLPGSLQQRLSAMDYPWGFPPPWDDPEIRRRVEQADAAAFNDDPQARAWHLVSGTPQIQAGLDELEDLARLLEGRGARVVLAEMPYDEPLLAALKQRARHYELYRARLDAYLQASGREVVPAPRNLTQRHFYDLDHLSRPGATRMAAWLKQHLSERRSDGTPWAKRRGETR